jgi:hypothetical protein
MVGLWLEHNPAEGGVRVTRTVFSFPNQRQVKSLDFARVDLGISNKLGHCLRRNGWVYRHNEGDRDDACDGCDVAQKVEIKFLVKRRIDRGRRADQEAPKRNAGARQRLRPDPENFGGEVSFCTSLSLHITRSPRRRGRAQ